MISCDITTEIWLLKGDLHLKAFEACIYVIALRDETFMVQFSLYPFGWGYDQFQ